jgi:hypothetical protein
MSQEKKNVDEYHKKMKIVMIHVNKVKDREATKARFFNGLNHKIIILYGVGGYGAYGNKNGEIAQA